LTREIVDLLRERGKGYLSTLAPLLRPQNVFGDFGQGSTKGTIKGAETALKELQDLYESVAEAKPFNLAKELKPPIEIANLPLEMTTLEYDYQVGADPEGKLVTITSPLKWALSYSGFAPGRLKDLLADRNRDSDQLRQFVLRYLVMHLIISKQTGVGQILNA